MDSWVKFPRNLRGKFSNCKGNDSDCIWLYVNLVIESKWCEKSNIGKFNATNADLCGIMTNWSRSKIRRNIDILVSKGFIEASRVSIYKNAGYIITLCHYTDQTAYTNNTISKSDISTHDLIPDKNRPSTDHQPTINRPSIRPTQDPFNELNLNDNCDDEEKNRPSIRPSIRPSTGHQPAKHIIKELKNKRKINITSPDETKKLDDFIIFWNSTVVGRIAKAKKLNSSRIKKIKAFLVDSTFEDFQKITSAIIKSPWHNGSESEWVADFDWVFSDKALKLVEKSEHIVNNRQFANNQPNGVKILT